jgi:hypothetical protein
VGKLIGKIRQNRRDRRLARELEMRFRAQIDSRMEAAALMAEELRRS